MKDDIDAIAITITAETVGIFNTLSNGIIKIAQICNTTFELIKTRYIAVDGKMHTFSDVLNKPIDFASANWVATSYLASKFIDNGFFIDIGSTTTDIIPIINKKVSPFGKTDMNRLRTRELIYAGLLRTFIQSIVNKLPYKDEWIYLSSEMRCFTAHVYVYLGLIEEQEMLHPFAGKPMMITKSTAKEAIARSICADSSMLSDDDIYTMAQYIYEKQIEEVEKAIEFMIKKSYETKVNEINFVVAGSGSFLAKKAINNIGYTSINAYEDLVQDMDNATAVALTTILKDSLK
ncbi:hydantoinase/oxoprolinase family protein [Clostridium sporogenes]|uniref:hydantoinase/oxoprolinase family protein n=1 Tax=Clostridium sporogenes TaxID=1509 RepID=UPI002874B62A|nr:hydantoinase/oxoprolinase family protein [Clostridium sporogenes]MDS1006666.1 hydantoinase/oxoprolinase family protein [Clostridium sporogenes]